MQSAWKRLDVQVYLLKPVLYKQQLLFDAVCRCAGPKRKIDQKAWLHVTCFQSIEKLGLRILLAEDNPINQKLALILFAKGGLFCGRRGNRYPGH